MTEKTTRKPPTGLNRLMFRAPIWLYRLGLGWLLKQRFLLLNHIGRKSGQVRQAVLEVAGHDTETDTYFVASGFGRKSQWFQNVQAQPEVTIQVGHRKLAATADILDPAASGQMMVDYARRHPTAAQNLSKVIGVEVDGTVADYRRVGEEEVPFVALRKREVIQESLTLKQTVVPLSMLAGMIALVAYQLRKGKRNDED